MSAPTEQRAARLRDEGKQAEVLHADVEEHVHDPLTGGTLRCDVTLRDNRAPLLIVEMKRPEVAEVDSPSLTRDAHAKALSRGLPLYGTCNFAEAALWRTSDEPRGAQPLHRIALAPELRHSSGAPSRRREIQDNWQDFLDVVESQFEAIRQTRQRRAQVLPPQVEDLREAVQHVADEAAARIAEAVQADPDRFATLLTQYDSINGQASEVSDLESLARGVSEAKQAYQACRYSRLVKDLPELLSTVQRTSEETSGDDRLACYGLSAHARHIAASVLLKHGDLGTAWLAADRSMRAARASEDPLMLASSARIVTHALTSSRHLGAAKDHATTTAASLSKRLSAASPDFLSVYGSLLLRGSIAAAENNDRAGTYELLDEAETAARHLGGDYNHSWTAFGLGNVLLHRVSTAVAMGDAGVAIDYARKVDVGTLPITERKAALFIDTARAFAQWGKHDSAYQVLRAADDLAHEEVATRPVVHRLIRDMLATAPPSTGRHVREFADHVGVQV